MKAIRIVNTFPVPPAMPLIRPALRPSSAPTPPFTPPTLPSSASPPPTPTPPAARRTRPAVAGALGVVPGLGHLYAGRPLRGLLLLLLAPAAITATALGALPVAGYALLHGYAAFDGYRAARRRNGAWSREDAREARGIWFATVAVLALLGVAHAAGAPFSAAVVWPALLVPLGVGLALGGRPGERVVRAAPAPPAPPPVPTEPAPGVDIDRRADRARLAEQLCG